MGEVKSAASTMSEDDQLLSNESAEPSVFALASAPSLKNFFYDHPAVGCKTDSLKALSFCSEGAEGHHSEEQQVRPQDLPSMEDLDEGQAEDETSKLVSDEGLFALLPTDLLYFELFLKLEPFPNYSRLFLVCKRWSQAATCDFFWKLVVSKHFAPLAVPRPFSPFFFKPEGRDWKWIVKTKRPVPREELMNFTGEGTFVDQKDETSPVLSHYEGEWVDGKREGWGLMVTEAQDFYVGSFRDNSMEGEGVFYCQDGNRYSGSFVQNERSGRGVFEFVSGERYEGIFEKGEYSGQGIFTWADGTYCQGTFEAGAQRGFGEFVWSNGNRYVGEFEKDARHGHGRLIQKDGHVVEGWWNKDALVETMDAPVDPARVMDLLHPEVAEAIKKKVCTFTATGREAFAQFFYETRSVDGRSHGLCVVCAQTCAKKKRSPVLARRTCLWGKFLL
eukprot:TRINITY_DN5058_c0_g1_i1.p1 TRINITY_DN5058_c0_g1~~TRINITY_DN5058_c0_g1_i1.p1  ORF type:complete len:446 (-),score=60.14 TRINITY_DN5058_c0_g1_i1:174-1511(-)